MRAVSERGAEICDRALITVRLCIGQANGRPQFHERLREDMRRAVLEDAFSCLSDYSRSCFFDGIGLQVKQTRKHAPHIAVDGRNWKVEGDGADGPDGVRTESRKASQVLRIGRQRFLPVGDDEANVGKRSIQRTK